MKKNWMKTAVLVILAVLVYVPGFSQKKKPLKIIVKETMELRRKGQHMEGLSPFKDYIVDSAQVMITNFKPYASDTADNLRSFAYDAIGVTGMKAKVLKIRQSAVDILVNGCLDKEAYMRKNISKKLTHFLKNDYTQQAKQKLAGILKLDKMYYQDIVKIIGFLDMSDQAVRLKMLLDSGQLKNKTLVWDIHLSLARLGNKDEIKYCVDLVRNKGINDKVIYNLFPDLVYTRSREAATYMLEILNSDSKDCFSTNPDKPIKISCAYRVLEFLAPMIKNYPLKTNKDGELDIEDYEKSLITCREWFKQHSTDYVIDKERL